MKRMTVPMILVLAAGSAFAAPARPALSTRVERFMTEYLPWEPESKVTATADPAKDIPGFHAYLVNRTGKYEKLNTKNDVLVSADEHLIFTGSTIDNTVKSKATVQIRTDADVVGVADYFGHLFRSSARAALDPGGDHPGIKGVLVELNTGYFPMQLHYGVAADGSRFFMGQFWKLDEDVREQRLSLIDLSGSPAAGAASPKITIIEFADMECPFCKRRGLAMDVLMEKYGQKFQIRRYYKYYPLWVNHVWSMKAASAGVCLSKSSPDLMMKFKHECYDHQETLDLEKLDQLVFDVADAGGVSRKDFLACYLQPESFAPIARDMAEGGRLGIQSTPTYYVNGTEIYWLPDEVMEEYLKTVVAGKK